MRWRQELNAIVYKWWKETPVIPKVKLINQTNTPTANNFRNESSIWLALCEILNDIKISTVNFSFDRLCGTSSSSKHLNDVSFPVGSNVSLGAAE